MSPESTNAHHQKRIISDGIRNAIAARIKDPSAQTILEQNLESLGTMFSRQSGKLFCLRYDILSAQPQTTLNLGWINECSAGICSVDESSIIILGKDTSFPMKSVQLEALSKAAISTEQEGRFGPILVSNDDCGDYMLTFIIDDQLIINAFMQYRISYEHRAHRFEQWISFWDALEKARLLIPPEDRRYCDPENPVTAFIKQMQEEYWQLLSEMHRSAASDEDKRQRCLSLLGIAKKIGMHKHVNTAALMQDYGIA